MQRAAPRRPGSEFFCNACNTTAQIAGIFSGTRFRTGKRRAGQCACIRACLHAPRRDVNLAAGAEYQRDTYIVEPSEAILNHVFSDFTVARSVPAAATHRFTWRTASGVGNSFTFPGAASLGIDVAARTKISRR